MSYVQHMSIVNWLVTNRPGSHWTLNGDTYEDLIWLDDPSTKPTKAEIEG